MTTKRIAALVVVLALAGVGVWWFFSERGAAREVASAPASSVQPRPATQPAAESPAPAPPTALTTSPAPAPSEPPPPASGAAPSAPAASDPAAQPTKPLPALDRCIGTNPDAPVLLEVFSDHQCPACRRFYLDVTRPLLADYAMKGKVCVVYHEFPLRQHQYAREAARYTRAAIAAGLSQEDWVRLSDALYYYQPQWSADGNVEAVVANALPDDKMARLRKALDDPGIETAIDHEIELGRDAGVRSTPTVFITAGGRTESIPAGVQYPILRRYIDNLLAPAQ